RLGLLLQPVVFSVEARLTLPTGDPEATIPSGTGDLRTEIRLLGAKLWRRRRASIIAEGEVGFTNRGNASIKNRLLSSGSTQTTSYSPEVFLHGEADLVFPIQNVGLQQLIFTVYVEHRASTQGFDPVNEQDTFTVIPRTSSLTTVVVGGMWYFLPKI